MTECNPKKVPLKTSVNLDEIAARLPRTPHPEVVSLCAKSIDASWADIVSQRKSSISYLIFCNNAVFTWKASLSSVLAMSSAEAEMIALCDCAADVAYCRKLANELGFLQLRPTIIHEDNLGAKQIAESGNFKGRSKHFELRWRFLHHYINRGIVSIKAIKRSLQLADIGTVSRGYPQLQQMGAVIHGEV